MEMLALDRYLQLRGAEESRWPGSERRAGLSSDISKQLGKERTE
jgi:hypothetical protein